ncbi:hypothetical protein [Tardiphaga sp. 619_E2_N8_5]|uniref:hypothetical protein n=1 Tax=unclassified Tardiphaga TaxID=2631404 RepID=UPI003F266057
MSVERPEYSVRRLADDLFAIEARGPTGKAKLLAGSFERQTDATQFVRRLRSKPAAVARAEIAETVSDSGYTVDFLAFKHGLTHEQASQLIREAGNSRKTLDAAATALNKGSVY